MFPSTISANLFLVSHNREAVKRDGRLIRAAAFHAIYSLSRPL
jgi:hypothetical protein